MESTLQCLLRLTDNSFGDHEQIGYGKDISSEIEIAEINAILCAYEGKSLDQWAKLGVAVFTSGGPSLEKRDDYSHRENVFSLGMHGVGKPTRTWINTHNCMGVVRLFDKSSGVTVQVEIGSRFDKGHSKPYFLSYLLSKVFGGSIVGNVRMSQDSLWDMLLAFVFRRRLLEAGAVGIYKQYRTLHHNDTRIRGRVDVGRHLRQNIPFCGNVAYATHEITFDNPTNHLIRHALAKVTRKWGGLMTGDNRLTELRHQLERNTPRWQSGNVQSCIRCKENRTPIRHPFFHSAYEPLRQISLAILREEGAGLYQQHQEAEGVIFDGSWLWEEYLWTLLKPLGFEHPENKRGTEPWKPLVGIELFPDFFHREKRIVLDAKYKRASRVNLEDIRQVFAYMFVLDAVHGGLIKPEGTQRKPQEIKRISPIDMGPVSPSWHEFAMPPPSATTACDFVEKMKTLEIAFKKSVCSQCGIRDVSVG